jgi:hypothetical protein
VVLRLWPRSRRLSIAPGRAARGSQRKCGRRRSPRGAQSLRERCVCVVCQSTSSCYSQLSRIFEGKGAVSLCVCFLLAMGVLGTVWNHPKRTYGPLNAGKLNVPTTKSEKGRMTVVVHDRPMGYQDVEGGSGKGGSGVSGGSEGGDSEGEDGGGEGVGGEGVGGENGGGEGGGGEGGGGEGGGGGRCATPGGVRVLGDARGGGRARACRW